jgi:hypothetical protein
VVLPEPRKPWMIMDEVRRCHWLKFVPNQISAQASGRLLVV